MPYRVIDIYKDLPRTNCGACGRPGCFAFASAVYLEGLPLSHCPEIRGEELASMEDRLRQTRERGEGPKSAAHEQALAALLREAADAEFGCLAPCAAARFEAGPPECLEVPFLDARYRVLRDAEGVRIEPVEGEAPTLWIQIVVLIYLLRAKGTEPRGEWKAFREFPGAAVKAVRFEKAAERIALFFQGRTDALDRTAATLAARRLSALEGSPDRAYAFRALPRVEFLLLYWERSEEFPARASILVDRTLTDYLDPEAAAFAADCFAARLLGESLSQVIE